VTSPLAGLKTLSGSWYVSHHDRASPPGGAGKGDHAADVQPASPQSLLLAGSQTPT